MKNFIKSTLFVHLGLALIVVFGAATACVYVSTTQADNGKQTHFTVQVAPVSSQPIV